MRLASQGTRLAALDPMRTFACVIGIFVAIHAASAFAQRTHLRVGEGLTTGQYLQSPNKTSYAVMQADGNLCVYRGTPAAPQGGLWCHHKVGPGGQFVTVMQADGNLCTYRGTSPTTLHGATWCSNVVSGGGPVFLAQQDDGNLCVYKGTPTHYSAGLWCHNTNVRAAAPAGPPPRRGVTVVNRSASHSWITIYSETIGIRTIKKAGCLKPGQENSWSDVPIVAAGAPAEKIVVRVERTKTANCAALPNNGHVTCDTAASWDKLGGLESAAYLRKPYVVFTFNDGCYIDTDR